MDIPQKLAQTLQLGLLAGPNLSFVTKNFYFEVELPKTWRLNFFCLVIIDRAIQCEQNDITGISSKLAQNLFFGLKVDPIFSIFRKSRLWGWIAEKLTA